MGQFLSSIVSNDLKVTDHFINLYWIGRVLENRIFGKRLALVWGPHFHKRYPSFSVDSFYANFADKEETFILCDSVTLRGLKSPDQMVMYVRFDQSEKSYKVFSC